MDAYYVLEIDSPEIAEFAAYFDSDLKTKDYETQLKSHYLILGFPRSGRVTLVNSLIFHKHFETIESEGSFYISKINKKQVEEVDPLRKIPFIQKDES